jgi:hypothetical protein
MTSIYYLPLVLDPALLPEDGDGDETRRKTQHKYQHTELNPT